VRPTAGCSVASSSVRSDCTGPEVVSHQTLPLELLAYALLVVRRPCWHLGFGVLEGIPRDYTDRRWGPLPETLRPAHIGSPECSKFVCERATLRHRPLVPWQRLALTITVPLTVAVTRRRVGCLSTCWLRRLTRQSICPQLSGRLRSCLRQFFERVLAVATHRIQIQ
jgi:hypothetical protein